MMYDLAVERSLLLHIHTHQAIVSQIHPYRGRQSSELRIIRVKVKGSYSIVKYTVPTHKNLLSDRCHHRRGNRTHPPHVGARTSNPSVRASRDHALFSDRSTTCKRWYPNCVLMGPQMAPSLRVLKVNSRSGLWTRRLGTASEWLHIYHAHTMHMTCCRAGSPR